jgi:hypothetical protein
MDSGPKRQIRVRPYLAKGPMEPGAASRGDRCTVAQCRDHFADGPVRVDAPLTPRQNFGITGLWEREKIGRFGAECYYTGRQLLEDSPYRTESRPYVSIGFLVEHRFGPVRAFLNAENLPTLAKPNGIHLCGRAAALTVAGP